MKSKNLLIPTLGTFLSLILCASSYSASSKTPATLSADHLKQTSWWATVQKNIREQEYHVTYHKKAYIPDKKKAFQAANRAQNLRTFFNSKGIRVVRRTDRDPAWYVDLTLKGIGRGERILPLPEDKTPKTSGPRIEYHRGSVVEWYENRPEGLEQGFTINNKPGGDGNLELILRIHGNTKPVLSGDGKAVDFLTDSNARVLRYSNLHVVDAGETVLSSHLKLKDRTLKIVVDDTNASYPITIDPLLTSPSWTFEGDQENIGLGYDVDTAGDVNGDGYSDAVVGAGGLVYLFYGSATGLNLSPDWSATGLDGFGMAVGTAGDVNGDGYSDLLIGERYGNTAHLYYGSSTGLAGSPDWSVTVPTASNFGRAVATAGDVNGDGYSDIIVGSSGKAFVFCGSGSVPATTPCWEKEGSTGSFGEAVATAGDVNGDGYSDVIVGAPNYTNGQSSEGAVFVYHGSSGGLNTSHAWMKEGGQSNGLMGYSVNTAGDVNADGYSDVIVGWRNYDYDGLSGAGRATIYRGSATGLESGSYCRTLYGSTIASYFGYSVGCAGDVNGDGYADVIIGERQKLVSSSSEGAAHVYLGNSSCVDTQPYWSRDGTQQYGYFGGAVATAGDVNGDGFGDILVGEKGRTHGEEDEGMAYAFYGSGDAPESSSEAWDDNGLAGEHLGQSVSSGDFNGDGYPDIAAAAGGPHKVYIYYSDGETLLETPQEIEAPGSGGDFAYSISSAGDVNGDGYVDLLVGMPGYDLDPPDYEVGIAYLYLGSASGVTSVPSWSYEGSQAYERLGLCVGMAGDLNGDGYADLFISSPDHDGIYANSGQLIVFFGSATGPTSAPDWTFEGDQALCRLGYAAATAGDLNGDGFSDFVVGARNYDMAFSNTGRVYVFLGSPSGLPTEPDWVRDGDTAGMNFGHDVGSGGDVNGDGFTDLIVGAPSHDEESGKVFLFYGSPAGLGETASWTYENVSPGERIGYAVGSAGDVNGDGFSDIVIGGASTCVFTGGHQGLGSEPIRSYNASSTFERLDVDTAGDVNGDGFAEVLIGYYNHYSPAAGRVLVGFGNNGRGLELQATQWDTGGTMLLPPGGKSDVETSVLIKLTGRHVLGLGPVKMEWEMKPAGVPLDGTETGMSSTWQDSGNTGYAFQQLVTGLKGHTAYHWRARVRYPASNPLGVTAGRWAYPFRGAKDVNDFRTGNGPPTGGYSTDNLIPAAQITQSTDGNGLMTIHFRIKDAGQNLCTLHTFEYSINGGTNWNAPSGGDDSESLEAGWADNSGGFYNSATDWSGEVHSFTFNTRHPGVAGMDDVDQSDVKIRFTINDGLDDSSQPATSESFRVDNEAPVVNSFLVANDEDYTNDSTPELDIDVSGVTRMRFALSQGELSSATWYDYAPTHDSFDISSDGDGEKTVWAEFRDDFGNTTVTSDSITYDATPPEVTDGTIIILDSEGYTNDDEPDLQIYAVGASHMRFALNEVEDLSLASWVDYNTSYTTFSIDEGGDGDKWVWVQFKDLAGNGSIAVAYHTIYDTTPPDTGDIDIQYEYYNEDNSRGYTHDKTPVMYLYTDDAEEMRLALSEGGLSSAGWIPYATVHSGLDISGSDGEKTVWVEYRDRLGNTQSEHASEIVYYDSTAPDSEIDENQLPEYASGGSIEIHWGADDGVDGSGVYDTTLYYKRGVNTFWSSASLFGTDSPFDFTALSGDGDYYFTLVSEDFVENREDGPPVEVNDPGVYHVLYETAKPVSEATSVFVNDETGTFTVSHDYNDDAGAYVSGVTSVSLWVLASGATEYVLAGTHSGVTPFQPFQYTPDPLVEGSYKFYTIAEDRAGNVEDPPSQGYDIESIYSNEFAGYAILAVGSIAGEEGLDAHTLTANNVYTHLINRNFGLLNEPTLDHIKYFNPYFEPQPGEDDYSEGGTVSYWDGLRKAITEWALNRMKVRPGPLYIILIDHGTPDKFHLTGTQHVTPVKLDEWVTSLENDMSLEGIPSQDIVIILGTCFSATFIEDLSGTSRIIVTSTATDEPSYRGPMEPGGVRDGEFFITNLFNELGQGFDLKRGFERSVQRTEIHTDSGVTNSPAPYFDTAMQHPHLEDDGIAPWGSNSLTSSGDGNVAKDIYLGFGIGAPDPVVITAAGTEPEIPLSSVEDEAVLWATVSGTTSEEVWVEIREPGTTLEGGQDQQVVDLEEVSLTWSPGDNRYQAAYDGFDASGRYTLFFYTRDTSGILSPFYRVYLYKSMTPNDPPGSFGLISPESGATVDASAGVGFVWEESIDPDGHPVTYTVEVWDDAADPDWSGATFYHREEGFTKNFCVIGEEAGFVDARSYLWGVTAIDEYGADTESEVSGFVIDNENPLLGWIAGLVYDADTDEAILDADVTAPGLTITMSGTGYYLGVGPAGPYMFSLSALGYEPRDVTGVQVPEGAIGAMDFWMAEAADTDGDGMPDEWEDLYEVDDASGDPDGDGLTNLEEYLNGTLPKNPDSDNDGMRDGWEVDYGLEPDDDTGVNGAAGDLDGDGWTNLQEYQRGTLPNDADSHPSKAMPWLMLLLGNS